VYTKSNNVYERFDIFADYDISTNHERRTVFFYSLAQSSLKSGALGRMGEDEVDQLKAELKEAKDREATVCNAYCILEQETGAEVQAALDKHEAVSVRIKAESVALKERLARQAEAHAEQEATLARTQAELRDASAYLAKYEAGVFGLPEAMRDIKRLKKEVRVKEEQQQNYIRKANDSTDLMEQVTTQNQYLRERLGIAPDEQLEMGDFEKKMKVVGFVWFHFVFVSFSFRFHFVSISFPFRFVSFQFRFISFCFLFVSSAFLLQVEVNSLRALNSQLESEVQELEEERLRLKAELRYRAKWHGEAAAKMNLSPTQLLLLEDYANGLRVGEMEGVYDDMLPQVNSQQ
jgi:centrosomal protein CEP290